MFFDAESRSTRVDMNHGEILKVFSVYEVDKLMFNGKVLKKEEARKC